MIVLELPIPPSVNGLFLNAKGKGRVKTRAYSVWCTEVDWTLKRSQRLPEGAYAVTAWIPLNRKSDLDNRIKAILDALVRNKVVPDDRWCDRIIAHRADPSESTARVTVETIA